MQKSSLRFGVPILLTALLAASPALAGPRGGGASRGEARSSVNTTSSRDAGQNRNTNVNKNTNVNQNTTVNKNTNVNVNRDVDVEVNGGGYGYGGCCYNEHPVAAAAAVTATVAATAAVIGSIVNTPPPNCVPTVVNGITYQQCGSTWYQPQYAGTSVNYVVVDHP